MRILFDNQIFKIQNFGGVSRYYAELINGLNNSPDFEPVPKKLYSLNKHLRLNGLTYLDSLSDHYQFFGKARVENFLRKRDEISLIKTLKTGKFDVFHPTYYNAYFINDLPLNKPFVLTVFDMIHELYLDEKLGRVHDETKYKKELIPKATHIVAISQNTKDDILRFFPDMDEKKISVVYLGSSFSASNAASEIGTPEKYILYVGNRNDYKNFRWFLQSIAGFLRTHKLVLMCAGGGDFSEDELMQIRQEKLEDKVKRVQGAGDNELAALYKQASCFVFPSLHEGFGIPILEAFSCRCPVVLPHSSCFPEIAGNAALYYEPGNAGSLVEKLERITSDADLAESLRDAGLNRLPFFSWEKTVSQHIGIYESLNKPVGKMDAVYNNG